MADYLNYVLSNPDLRENAEALGLTNAEMAEWGQWHFDAHGKNEGRQNTPTEITNTGGYTEALGSQHYQGRDVEDVLQASVRSAQGGDFDESMWTAREAIDPTWNLGQFTAEGWNFDPDNPYKTGILGNTISVNEDIGQLVPTTAGDQRFLQDRYVDDSIANDFPVGWTTNQNTWAGPEQLGNYWDVLTNATRNTDGILRRAEDYDPLTAVGPSVSPGSRGGGNIRSPQGGGLLNPTVPTFRGPGYQDWTRFMPTDFQLAEGGGMHYQPWASGMPAVGGGNFVARPNPIFTTGGGTTGGGTFMPMPTHGPGTIGTDPNIWGGGGGSSGNTVTDAQGNTWIMSPQGNWVPADSDYGQGLLGTGRLHPDYNFYDSSGAYVGAEGAHEGTNSPGFSNIERLTGVATDYGGKWGNRQVGLNLLGNLGIMNNVGTFPVGSLGEGAIDLNPDDHDEAGDTGGDFSSGEGWEQEINYERWINN